MGSYGRTATRGAIAGILGSTSQIAVGFALDKLLLPPRQHNNIAPRLIKRLGQWTGRQGNAPRDWTLGTLFHVGYGVAWGTALSLGRKATGAPPLVTGAVGSALIYAAAFSSRGVGTLSLTEPPSSARGWRKQVSLVAVASTFAMATAVLDHWLDRRG